MHSIVQNSYLYLKKTVYALTYWEIVENNHN